MERISIGIGAVALAGMVGMMAWNAVSDPLDHKRDWLREELANLPPVRQSADMESRPFDVWLQAIEEKPHLWRQLVEPPAAPAPVAAAPTPPDLRKILEGVRASTSMVGDRVLIQVPGGNPRGTLHAVGDTIRGATLKEIGDQEVTFSLFWEQGNREIVLRIPRERRFN